MISVNVRHLDSGRIAFKYGLYEGLLASLCQGHNLLYDGITSAVVFLLILQSSSKRKLQEEYKE